DVLVLPMTDDLAPAIALSTALRAAGIRTQLYTEQKKFKGKMNYADKLRVPYVLFLGEDEINAGVVTCKNMATGEQVKATPEEVIEKIRAAIAEKAACPSILE
ncbi:MAG: histidine--tRNA ligase, partial [Oscillospiraceae bacterium]|nr:histidine--tRNA ligase [Oscillospiraceae bacterium]